MRICARNYEQTRPKLWANVTDIPGQKCPEPRAQLGNVSGHIPLALGTRSRAFLSGNKWYRNSLYYMRPCQLGRKLRHNLFFWYFLSKLHHSSYISDFKSFRPILILQLCRHHRHNSLTVLSSLIAKYFMINSYSEQLSEGKFTKKYREYHIFYI